jgi:hypothetical protein
MSSLVDKLIESVGRENVNPTSVMGRVIRQQAGVVRTGEFRRIEALPRRTWTEDAELARLMTEALRMPGGTAELWPVQAVAIKEAFENRGCFVSICVAGGKSVMSLVMPSIVDCERPLLIVPAGVRDQTLRILPEWKRQFRIRDDLRIVGSSEISLAKNADLLEEMKPDLIVCDEVHEFSNVRCGRGRRLVRYIRANPGTRVVAMSGTVTKRSLRDYAHIVEWCLHDCSPLPRYWNELTDWADALDEGIEEERRVPPGALLRLCEEGETVRSGFRRRLTETPGVVATGEHELGTSLRISRLPVDVPDDVVEALNRLRTTWETPDGDLIVEAVDLWRHAREVAMGFCYRWDPPAPRPWLDARRAWKIHVRETLKHNRRGLDTELQVWNEKAQEHGRPRKPTLGPEHEDDFSEEAEQKRRVLLERWKVEVEAWRRERSAGHCEFCAWLLIRDSFKPNTVPVWISDFAVGAAARWLKQGSGICWVEHRAFGERLASKTGLPYFGAGDSGILDAEGPIIASRRSHGTGLNLQRWNRNLMVCPVTSGRDFEQTAGRTHRPGQESDEVTFNIMLHTQELRDAMAQAIADARYIWETTGGKQRLCYADMDVGILR